MTPSREQVCQSAAGKLSAALPTLGEIPAVIGLDGFVDEIIAVVDKRYDRHRYDAVKTIADLGQKILRAAGQSSNYELLVKQTKLGGNGPIMSNALAAMGMSVTYIGNLGFPVIDPVFAEFAARAKTLSIAEPGHTLALEFEDGKVMLGQHQSLGDINWDNLVSRVGIEQLQTLINGARLIGLVNWTMLPFMSEIWSRLESEIFPRIERRRRTLFVDLADPEKRTHGDISEALRILSRLGGQMELILGLNLKESSEIAAVLGLNIPTETDAAEAAIETTARAIRQTLNLGCVVIHPRAGAAAATAEHSATIVGPYVAQPRISTGAGDHFNAGFCLGRVLGMSLEESLCTGVATSGYYVRNAQSPTGRQLADFLAKLPPPQQ
jgi:sugar/nucleoside kinase (ribokinase family)